ncbi:MAG: hypothetical protein ABI355_15510 [Solirubrobacteraceae bacterium]
MPRIRHVTAVSCSLMGLVAVFALAAPAAAAAYENPFLGASPIVGRTDMGVDVCLSPGDPIRAIGSGTVVGIMRDWYAGQPYIWYQLSSGPQVGQFVYVSEQIDHLARIGQTLQAGEVIARYAKSGSCLETGWSMADGETQAQATTGYKDGQVTAAGVSFARFLLGLGVTGQFQLSVPQTQTSRATTTKRHRKHRATPAPVAAPRPAPAPTAAPAPTPKPAPKPNPTPKPVSTSGPSPGPNFGPGTEPYWPAPN